jgi:hypothetical protein
MHIHVNMHNIHTRTHTQVVNSRVFCFFSPKPHQKKNFKTNLRKTPPFFIYFRCKPFYVGNLKEVISPPRFPLLYPPIARDRVFDSLEYYILWSGWACGLGGCVVCATGGLQKFITFLGRFDTYKGLLPGGGE